MAFQLPHNAQTQPPRDDEGLLDCCRKGHIHRGVPTGVVAGRKTYITGPQGADVSVFIIHDVFGIVINNVKVLADKLSEMTGATVYVPDFFDGDHVDFKYQTNDDEYLVKVVPEFMAKHPPRDMDQFVEAGRDIRSRHAKMVVFGICWGAPGTLYLGSGELADAVAVAHPSKTEATDWLSLTRPSLNITCQFDGIFTPEKRAAAVEATETTANERVSKWVYYPGCYHGFTLRGDETNPLTAQCMADALQELASFVRLHTNRKK
ncbi:hypothetical protein PROFUN_07713 [Planoprotostelium fungivorum]|uniref:Dienelactone hydrolase domain-containing protein n=1 Tax=Planoprotostelium fungivorum TaxID=1890364 RepID=A0A2P6N1F9_9EUKA|nr:hypothetical protein PROFUN_07713 [Planoprotostelium fungivorum]